jgi:hypothetical protein
MAGIQNLHTENIPRRRFSACGEVAQDITLNLTIPDILCLQHLFTGQAENQTPKKLIIALCL